MGVDERAIAILGGTGDQGLGLALRFAKAGRPVVIGSRKPERAVEAAEKVRAAVPGADVVGLENADAAARAPIGILSVPFEHCVGTLKDIRARLAAGQVLVSMGVPLATAVGDEVVSAFQNVSAHRLQALGEPVECDVVVSGAQA